jgi:hypothetical protein
MEKIEWPEHVKQFLEAWKQTKAEEAMRDRRGRVEQMRDRADRAADAGDYHTAREIEGQLEEEEANRTGRSWRHMGSTYQGDR